MGSNQLLEKDGTENRSKDLSNGTDSNLEAARRLAKRLYQLDRFKRSDVAKHLGKNNEFSKLVAEEYLKFFDFTGMTLDHSLRYCVPFFHTAIWSPYLCVIFALFLFPDGVHCLTCAVMLLNTDLHGHVSARAKNMLCPCFQEVLACQS
uniref:SEC7 domain-containing protein n=1 Tax=Terrapene triunguis TaxID=2587831 RepID=A0A674IQS2_9SAUR